MVTHPRICRCYPLSEESSKGLPRDRQRPTTPHRGKPLLGETFIQILSSSPGGLTYLTDGASLAVLFSPKSSILGSSYAPDGYQVEDRQMLERF
ncbi:MAG: hypothetical protein ACFFBD_28735, partial [Candidatus Hodarchaeota archaeon]